MLYPPAPAFLPAQRTAGLVRGIIEIQVKHLCHVLYRRLAGPGTKICDRVSKDTLGQRPGHSIKYVGVTLWQVWHLPECAGQLDLSHRLGTRPKGSNHWLRLDSNQLLLEPFD